LIWNGGIEFYMADGLSKNLISRKNLNYLKIVIKNQWPLIISSLTNE